jgi:hypothetical protein
LACKGRQLVGEEARGNIRIDAHIGVRLTEGVV